MCAVLNLNSAWGVVAGDASKELGFQAARVKREEEEIYSDLLSIPDNPKDLWDEEPLYDDTLTPEIPVEVLEISSSKAASPTAVVNQVVEHNPLTNGTLPSAKIVGEPHVASTKTYGGAQQIGDAASGHDPNLLALLLSNPHLVSQLASQQKGDGSLAGLSALLALGNVACQSASTQAQVLTQPTSNSNVSVQLQFPHAGQVVFCLFYSISKSPRLLQFGNERIIHLLVFELGSYSVQKCSPPSLFDFVESCLRLSRFLY
jgi:hypothetical protein